MASSHSSQFYHQKSHQRQQQRTNRSTSPPPPPSKRTIRSEDRSYSQNGGLFLAKEKPKEAGEILNGLIVSKMANGSAPNGHERQLMANGIGPKDVVAKEKEEIVPQTVEAEKVEKLAVPLAPATIMSSSTSKRQIYKLVLTGGPCGGKTTGQERLATFFEGLGWKVFTVPETASVLLTGRVRFQELNATQSYEFQKDLLFTLLQIEQVFTNQAELITDRNVLIIYDRGAVDPSAYMPREDWEKLLRDSKKDTFDLRDNRYNQIVHMVTAADGAAQYYTCANNRARRESMDEALKQDRRTREAWIGHQCLSIVDNADCANFDEKIMKLIKVVCERLGIAYEDRFAKNSKKRKWLILGADEAQFRANKFEEFQVTHYYLVGGFHGDNKLQTRLRKRCQNGRTTYTLTTRRYVGPDGTKLPEPVETRKQLTAREFNHYISMRDRTRSAVHKKRRCFVFGNVYFHLDTYVDPLPPACNGHHPLMILETYTTKPVGNEEPRLPPFLRVDREITGEPSYSMYNLAASRAHQASSNASSHSPPQLPQQQNGFGQHQQEQNGN